MSSPCRLPRGIYRIYPDGPKGETMLFVVDSHGRRIRTTGELEPIEVAEAIVSLQRWLDQRDQPSQRLRVV